MKHFLFFFFTFTVYFLHAQIPGLSQLILKVDPSVIKIYTVNTRNEYESQGSGIIIANNGTCITNYHVLIGAKKAVAITSDGKKYDITKIFDYSKSNDLIKFKIETNGKLTTPVSLNAVLPLKGSDVFAVGYPNGFKIEGESTLSTGIVSGFREEGGEKIIQTSTPFTHGSSGGGLFDKSGKLLGITTGTFAEELKDRHANLNKVIPVVLINKLTKNLNLSLLDFYNSIKNDENYVLGMISYEQMDFYKASEYFSLHLDDYPEDATAWFRLGNSYHQLGRRSSNGSLNQEILEKALGCFEISISLDTNYYHPWGQAALVNSIIGEDKLAKYCGFKAYEIEPKVSFTNYVIGKVANESGDYSIAIDFLTYAMELADEFDQANLLHQWYLERAIAYTLSKTNDYRAEGDYKKCLQLNANNLDCYYQYGVFLGNRNRKNEACTNFRILYGKSPNYRVGEDKISEIVNGYCK